MFPTRGESLVFAVEVIGVVRGGTDIITAVVILVDLLWLWRLGNPNCERNRW
jgi:hypothetical protein